MEVNCIVYWFFYILIAFGMPVAGISNDTNVTVVTVLTTASHFAPIVLPVTVTPTVGLPIAGTSSDLANITALNPGVSTSVLPPLTRTLGGAQLTASASDATGTPTLTTATLTMLTTWTRTALITGGPNGTLSMADSVNATASISVASIPASITLTFDLTSSPSACAMAFTTSSTAPGQNAPQEVSEMHNATTPPVVTGTIPALSANWSAEGNRTMHNIHISVAPFGTATNLMNVTTPLTGPLSTSNVTTPKLPSTPSIFPAVNAARGVRPAGMFTVLSRLLLVVQSWPSRVGAFEPPSSSPICASISTLLAPTSSTGVDAAPAVASDATTAAGTTSITSTTHSYTTVTRTLTSSTFVSTIVNITLPLSANVTSGGNVTATALANGTTLGQFPTDLSATMTFHSGSNLSHHPAPNTVPATSFNPTSTPSAFANRPTVVSAIVCLAMIAANAWAFF